jgi:hypothetical protein
MAWQLATPTGGTSANAAMFVCVGTSIDTTYPHLSACHGRWYEVPDSGPSDGTNPILQYLQPVEQPDDSRFVRTRQVPGQRTRHRHLLLEPLLRRLPCDFQSRLAVHLQRGRLDARVRLLDRHARSATPTAASPYNNNNNDDDDDDDEHDTDYSVRTPGLRRPERQGTKAKRRGHTLGSRTLRARCYYAKVLASSGGYRDRAEPTSAHTSRKWSRG